MSTNGHPASPTTPTDTHVDTSIGGPAPEILPPSLPVASANGHTNGNPPDIVGSDEGKHIKADQEEEEEEGETWIEDRDWEDEEGSHATANEDDILVLEEDPTDMSSWAGQPSVKGSSEVMRMVLLTFSSVGMTSVSSPYPRYSQFPLLIMCYIASHGVSK